jgi:hypothetical protein
VASKHDGGLAYVIFQGLFLALAEAKASVCVQKNPHSYDRKVLKKSPASYYAIKVTSHSQTQGVLVAHAKVSLHSVSKADYIPNNMIIKLNFPLLHYLKTALGRMITTGKALNFTCKHIHH